MFSEILTAEFQFLSFTSPIFTKNVFSQEHFESEISSYLTMRFSPNPTTKSEKTRPKWFSSKLKVIMQLIFTVAVLAVAWDYSVGRPDCIKLWWSLISRRYRRKWLVGMKLKWFQRSNEISYFSFLIFCSIRNYNLYF